MCMSADQDLYQNLYQNLNHPTVPKYLNLGHVNPYDEYLVAVIKFWNIRSTGEI